MLVRASIVVAMLAGWAAVASKSLSAVRDRAVWRTLTPPEPPIPPGHTPIAGLDIHVRQAMLHWGVPLVVMPRGSGKTTAARLTADAMLREGRFSGVAHVVVPPNSTECVSKLIARHMGVDDVAKEMSQLADGRSPILVVVDDADQLARTPHEDQLRSQSDLVHLAGASMATKDFVIVMLFDTLEAAHQVGQWNGGSKIQILRPYDADGVLPTTAELDTAVACAVSSSSIDAGTTIRLTELARRARSIGFVADVAAELRQSNDRSVMERAAERADADGQAAAEWVVGVNEWLRPETPFDRQLVLVREWQAADRAAKRGSIDNA